MIPYRLRGSGTVSSPQIVESVEILFINCKDNSARKQDERTTTVEKRDRIMLGGKTTSLENCIVYL